MSGWLYAASSAALLAWAVVWHGDPVAAVLGCAVLHLMAVDRSRGEKVCGARSRR